MHRPSNATLDHIGFAGFVTRRFYLGLRASNMLPSSYLIFLWQFLLRDYALMENKTIHYMKQRAIDVKTMYNYFSSAHKVSL